MSSKSSAIVRLYGERFSLKVLPVELPLSGYELRPDCYVGLCGARPEADAIAGYFSKRIGIQGS